LKKLDPKKLPGSRYSYEGLDRIIHERARLSVLTSLITHASGLSFVDLKRLCALTDGNLARHLQVLETEKLVSITKGMEGNRPQTLCRVTALGRRRYVEYLAVLEQVVIDATRAVTVTPKKLDPLGA
jgi:DNA-binding HxlR family transcriptional regulator